MCTVVFFKPQSNSSAPATFFVNNLFRNNSVKQNRLEDQN